MVFYHLYASYTFIEKSPLGIKDNHLFSLQQQRTLA